MNKNNPIYLRILSKTMFSHRHPIPRYIYWVKNPVSFLQCIIVVHWGLEKSVVLVFYKLLPGIRPGMEPYGYAR